MFEKNTFDGAVAIVRVVATLFEIFIEPAVLNVRSGLDVDMKPFPNVPAPVDVTLNDVEPVIVLTAPPNDPD